MRSWNALEWPLIVYTMILRQKTFRKFPEQQKCILNSCVVRHLRFLHSIFNIAFTTYLSPTAVTVFGFILYLKIQNSWQNIKNIIINFCFHIKILRQCRNGVPIRKYKARVEEKLINGKLLYEFSINKT